MPRVVLTAAERETLESAKRDQLELIEQIDAGVEAGVVRPSMAAAAQDQLEQIETLLTTFS